MSNDPKLLWLFARSKKSSLATLYVMRYDDAEVTEAVPICNLFGEYFSSNFINGNLISHDGDFKTYAPAFLTIYRNQVLEKLKQLDVHKSAGSDNMPALFLRNCAEKLATPLAIIFNKSLSQRKFPTLWKRSFITPIFKSGGVVSNYRPISILPTVSKLLELIVYEHTGRFEK